MGVITARGLTKTYGELTAVDGIDFDVSARECFGMLGPNGAGKSTTMRMIGCVTPQTAGELDVLGMDVRDSAREIKARIGVVPQDDSLDDDLTVLENLVVYAGYFGIRAREARERARELLGFMALGGRPNARVRELSGGMKRRLVIARALVNDPELVLLDEPTTGLDPQARHHIWERLQELKDGGATLVLTTHYMEEAARLCDRLVIMDEAEILVEGTPKDLIRSEIPRHVVEVPLRLVADLDTPLGEALDGSADQVSELSDRVVIYTNESGDVIRRLAASGIDETQVFERMASLEDVFLRLTGREVES